MAMMACPVCGWQTLDSVELAGGASAKGPGMILFECGRCAWFGTAAAPGREQPDREMTPTA